MKVNYKSKWKPDKNYKTTIKLLPDTRYHKVYPQFLNIYTIIF